jgi:hypothetical protein
MTMVITASVPVRTSDMRCSADGARSLATHSARPIDVTRITRPAPPAGSAWRLAGANMVGSMPSPRSPLSRIRDRALMAASRSAAKRTR